MDKTDELEDRIKPSRGKQPSKKKQKNMKKVVENVRELYRVRNYIISVFEGSEKGIKAKDRKSVDLSWLRYSDYFEILKRDYNKNPKLSQFFTTTKRTINLDSIGKFIKDISSGKLIINMMQRMNIVRKLRRIKIIWAV